MLIDTSELQKMGIKLLLIDTQCDYVHFSDAIFRREKHLQYEPVDEKNAAIISIILDGGECIVGDLEPKEYLDAYEKNIALQNDWNLIMSYHPKIIYYAHANEKHFV